MMGGIFVGFACGGFLFMFLFLVFGPGFSIANSLFKSLCHYGEYYLKKYYYHFIYNKTNNVKMTVYRQYGIVWVEETNYYNYMQKIERELDERIIQRYTCNKCGYKNPIPNTIHNYKTYMCRNCLTDFDLM